MWQYVALQHRWQDSRTEYSSWRPCFHKNCPKWASQIQYPRQGCNAKPQTTWKRVRDIVRWVVFQAVPYIRRNLLTFGEHPKKPIIRNAWFQSEIWKRFCDGLGSCIVVQHFVGTIITLHSRITGREYGLRTDWVVSQVNPMSQMLFQNNDVVFQEAGIVRS
jgi:hypothetical protein